MSSETLARYEARRAQIHMTSRRSPMRCQTLEEAQRWAKDGRVAIWCRIWSCGGIYHVWPGGRTVHYQNG